MNKLLYHYTTFGNLEKIIKSGFLMVSPLEKKNKIKRPALWLTQNPNWDNTATKGFYDKNTGKARSLTFEEQDSMFGCVRITIRYRDKYCNWETFKQVSKESIELRNQLEIIGIEQGSNPNDWYVSFEDVANTDFFAIDFWNGSKWENVFNEETELLSTKSGNRDNLNTKKMQKQNTEFEVELESNESIIGLSIDYYFTDGSRKYFSFEMKKDFFQKTVDLTKKYGISKDEKNELKRRIACSLNKLEWDSNELLVDCMELATSFDSILQTYNRSDNKNFGYFIELREKDDSEKVFGVDFPSWTKMDDKLAKSSIILNSNIPLN